MTPAFEIRYNPAIYTDIQQVVDYYYEATQNELLGNKFVESVKSALDSLSNSALHFQIRYDDIRFLPIPSFSFVAHYWVNEARKIVWVEAILHTGSNPDSWKSRV